MNKKTTRVVIVGGGFGGVKAALELAKDPRFQVQLISNNAYFEYHGALYRSAVGHSPKEVVIPLRDIFKGKANVEIVLDEIGYIDTTKKLVAGINGEIYPYDKAILALGNAINYFGIKGLKEHTYNINTIGSTLRLRRKLIDLFSKPQRRALRIAVIGGGPTGIELASELATFAKLISKRHKISVPKLSITLIEGGERLLPVLEKSASEKIAKRLTKLGIEVYLKICVESCKENNLCLSAGDLHGDVLIWTAGSKPAPFFEANSSVFTLGRGGRVAVDEFLRPQGQKDLFVLGDNADTQYSGMAQTAIHDARFVARNLRQEVDGKEPKAYRTRKPLYVITAGGKWAVVQKNKRVISGRRGWRIRRQADLWIFKNFEPYKEAVKLWRAGNKISRGL